MFKYSAKVLKSARKKARVTQFNLGYCLGIASGHQYISNCERGICRLSPRHFRPTAVILRMDVEKLVKAYLRDESAVVYREMIGHDS